MAKKATITPVTDTVNNAAAINTQLNAINDQLENTLSLDGSVPNAMGADLDLNNNDLLNVGTINGASASGLSAGLTTVIGLSTDIATVAGISADVTQVAADTVAINTASANASAAAASAGAASTSESNAAASEAAAAASYDAFDDRYLGAKAVEPTLDNDGDVLITGALYFNTIAGEMRVYNGAAWVAAYVSLSGALIANSNLSDLANATTSRANLGVAIGTDVQAYDANLNSFVGTFTLPTVDGTADQVMKTDGAGTITLADPESPFKPVAVTGATPSLDVGTYNYFDNGTLTADTTVTFASVPTEARWTYTADVGATSSYDIENASLETSFNTYSQDSLPQGFFFKPDGTKMYVIGTSTNSIYQYTLSTAWAVNTASYDSVSFSVSSQTTSPVDVFFKDDGIKMYVLRGDDGTGTLYQYTLSTAWAVNTASYDSVSFSVSSQQTYPYNMFFKDDGTKLYIGGGVNGLSAVAVHQYTLSTAWALNTASYDSVSFSLLSQMSASGGGLFFKPDGTKMYAGSGNDIFQYTLSTAWALNTASYDSVSISVTGSTDIFFDADGTKFYTRSNAGGGNPDLVSQYISASASTLTLPSEVQNQPTEAIVLGDQVSYTFVTIDGGTTVKLINEEVL